MSQTEIDALIAWHEKRITELNYPQSVLTELRRARSRWLPKPKK